MRQSRSMKHKHIFFNLYQCVLPFGEGAPPRCCMLHPTEVQAPARLRSCTPAGLPHGRLLHRLLLRCRRSRRCCSGRCGGRTSSSPWRTTSRPSLSSCTPTTSSASRASSRPMAAPLQHVAAHLRSHAALLWGEDAAGCFTPLEAAAACCTPRCPLHAGTREPCLHVFAARSLTR